MKTHRYIVGVVFVLAFTGVLLVLRPMATGAQEKEVSHPAEIMAAVGTAFTYQGQLTDGGVPADGLYDFRFELYDADEGIDPPLASLILEDVVVDQGFFMVKLYFGGGVFDGNARWMAIGVRPWDETGEFTTLEGRQEITPAPYAIYAQTAPWSGLADVPSDFSDGIDNDTTYTPGYGLDLEAGQFIVDTDEIQNRVASACPAGQSIRSIDVTGSVTCESDDDTTYTPGYGLDLAAGQFSVDTGEIQKRVASACPVDQSINAIDVTGAVTCDVDDDTLYGAGMGLTLSGGQFSLTASYRLPQGCGSGQRAEWNGSGWVCAPDNEHDHLGQTWVGADSALVISGTFSTQPYAPLVLNSNWNGLMVDQAGNDGLLVSHAGDDGLSVDHVGGDGVVIGTAERKGLSVWSAGYEGLYIDSSGFDGVRVSQAGSPSTSYESSLYNGLEINGAEGSGVYVGRADQAGLYVRETGLSGVFVEYSDGNGITLQRAGLPSFWVSSGWNNGLEIQGTEGRGIFIGRTESDGMYIYSAAEDGILINEAGDPSVTHESSLHQGLEIKGSEGDGIVVGRGDRHGLYVYSTGSAGVRIEEAGTVGVYANTTNAAGEWGFTTPDKINASNVTASTLTMIAQVGGDGPLSQGDLVAAVGLSAPLPWNAEQLPLVGLAHQEGYEGVVGVVEGRMDYTPSTESEGDEIVMELHSVEGAAQPGDYVAVTIYGVTWVRVDGGYAEDIQPGQRLTASAVAGAARPLRTESLNGMVVTEGAPVIGIALAAPEPGVDAIPVLVTLR